ncbi:hypothetical protein [Aurantiacibacter gilvus]|uniref:Transposase n=1 Tax=Aurantiacibacter gilvus TaxID=3139141 RepID=A0ABU9IHR0_9SPHN
MNTIFAGAHKHQNTLPCESKGPQAQTGNQSSFPALLSTLELRRLVAAMVD